MSQKAVRQWDAVRQFALGYPGAFEDFPWGTPVIKIDTGGWPVLFLWLGARDAENPSVYVKLTDSYDQAVAIAGAFPTTHSGVGAYGRLTIPLPVDDLDLLFDWVDESYRSVAPKRFLARVASQLETARRASSTSTPFPRDEAEGSRPRRSGRLGRGGDRPTS